MSTSPLRRAVDTLGGTAAGRYAISRIVCAKAPYFATIAPRFTRFGPRRVEATVRFRRAVQNHIGSVHAIVMCNLAELVGCTCVDLEVDPALRWIPTGMSVRYERIARTDIRGVCDATGVDFSTPGDRVVPVEVFDASGERVFSAEITMRLSAKKRG
jgi:acyl-coenzyme A thioesterase PaaI-like protein